jgi:hypothetical protein
MSSMLEKAIVDATALREAALKNAEASIIEKYAPEIKNAVETLLEQELGADIGMDDMQQEAEVSEEEGDEVDAPAAFLEGLGGNPKDGEDVELELTLEALTEMAKELTTEEEDETLEEGEEEVLEEDEEIIEEEDKDDDGAPAAPKWSKKGPKDPNTPRRGLMKMIIMPKRQPRRNPLNLMMSFLILTKMTLQNWSKNSLLISHLKRADGLAHQNPRCSITLS